METKIIKIDPKKIDLDLAKEAGEVIKNGGVCAFPTETVYGLGASALDENAVKKIFEAKGRPSDNPLIVHISTWNDIYPLVREVPEKAALILKHFMPGPISMILKKADIIPDAISAGLDTVAIRMPENQVAREIIKAAGVPVAAPSANTSGKPSPTRAKHVYHDMAGKIDMIVDGGSSNVGVESTVIDMTVDPPVILRPGAITADNLEPLIGKVISPEIKIEDKDTPKCPGMKYKHYAPKAKVVVIEYSNPKTMAEELAKLVRLEERQGNVVGVISDGSCDYSSFASIVLLAGGDSREYAKRLFKVLRDFDEIGADVVFAPICWQDSFMDAVRNRIYKASGNNIIRL